MVETSLNCSLSFTESAQLVGWPSCVTDGCHSFLSTRKASRRRFKTFSIVLQLRAPQHVLIGRATGAMVQNNYAESLIWPSCMQMKTACSKSRARGAHTSVHVPSKTRPH